MNFEKIKQTRKHSKLDAVEFENRKREMRNKDKNKRSVRKQKRQEIVDE